MCRRTINASIIAIACLWCAAQCQATIQWTATVTLSDPADGITIHTGGGPNTVVTVDSIDHQVYIIGASANQTFNVAYSMDLEYETNVIASDDTSGVLIQCDANGYWEHLANGTGSMSANVTAWSGNRLFVAYATISNNGGAGSSSKTDSHHATVVNP